MSGQQPLFLPASSWSPPELPSLAGRRRIALDIETKDVELMAKGPGFRRGARIVGVGIGVDGGSRMYFPVGHEGGGNLDERVVRDWAREELGSYTGEVVGANLGYDLDGLGTCWGVRIPARAFHDVQVAEPLLDEWRDEYNLDALSRDYLGEGKDEGLLREAAAAYGIVGSTEIKRNMWRFPANLVGPYVESDLDRPLRIFPLQEEKLRNEGLWELYDGIERRLVPILARMRMRGVRISERNALVLRERLVGDLAERLAELRRMAGPRAEFNAPEVLGEALRERGIDVPQTKKTDVPSITKPFLERHQKDPLAKLILDGRKIGTVINTFIDGQILGHAVAGRVHPTFKQSKDDDGGTIARFSGANPNLQFIPARDEELAPLVRGIFIPEEGEQWQRDDESQIEYRLLVHFAVGRGAEEARAKYNATPKTDYHKFVAEMLGVDPEDKVRRKRVKNTNFAKGYGAQAPKLADTFGCSVEEAEAFIKEYEEKLPFAKDTFDAAAKWAGRQGFVSSILGRKQRFPHWGPRGFKRHIPGRVFRSEAEAVQHYLREGNKYKGYPVRGVERVNTYMGLNRKLQSSAADVVKKWMVDAEEAGVTADGALGPLLVTVHDELGSSVPRTKRGDEAGRELKRLGEVAVKLKVPMIVDSERGESWGDCK
jgi:DNA polymerase I-like protein with 3'-5' exonuclease and polymerase domains